MNANLINFNLTNRAYVRVSKEESTKGLSPETQKNIIKDEAKKYKQKLDTKKPYYDDSGYPASINDEKIQVLIDGQYLTSKLPLNNRPAFKQMLEDAQKGEKFNLWFTRFDRFSRNNIFQELVYILLKQYGINPIPILDESEPFIRRLLGTLNQRESEKMGERVRDVMQYRFNQGLPRGKSYYGYKWLKIEKKLVEIPEQIETVKKAFQMTNQKKDYKTTCQELNISPKLYYNIIRNKYYAGINEYNGQTIKTCMPPIITLQEYEKANAQIKTTRKWNAP